MARKVFISVLGTSFYGKCIYALNEGKSSETRFIQQATIELLTAKEEWTGDDKGYILLTENAKTTNWIVENQQRKKGDKTETYIGLKDELNNMNLPFSIEPIGIPDGKNEAEIWKIFELVYNKLQEGDALYFDLTHGFRYLPMLVLVLGNYAKFLKKIKVESITYGNYETADKSISPIIAPVIDITPLSVLQDWTIAASDYLQHGTASKLKECSQKTLSPILAKTKGQDSSAQNLHCITTRLEALTDSIRFCRGMSIYEGKNAIEIHNLLQQTTNNYLKPLKPLFEPIDKMVCKWKEKNTGNMLLAAKLSADFGNWQSAATLLQEGVVSTFCIRHNIDVDDDKNREIVTKAIFKKTKMLYGNLTDYKPLEEEKEEKVNTICNDKLLTQSFIDCYSNCLSKIRNDVNHGGMRRSEKPRSINSIKKGILEFLSIANELEEASIPSIIINLSNHPSTEWDNHQIEAASKYGSIIDIPFPQIAPNASSEELDTIASNIIKRIINSYKNYVITVHVMGEMALTYRIVRKFTSMGIHCICSTTERVVRKLDNGEKASRFHFITFRDYE